MLYTFPYLFSKCLFIDLIALKVISLFLLSALTLMWFLPATECIIQCLFNLQFLTHPNETSSVCIFRILPAGLCCIGVKFIAIRSIKTNFNLIFHDLMFREVLLDCMFFFSEKQQADAIFLETI